VLQTNGEDLLLLADYGAFRYGIGSFKKIEIDPAKPLRVSSTNQLPDFKSVVLLLSRQAWASNLEQVPATVIDKGMLRHVPYVSFRCADDYEVNIYGDLEHPAGIEAGVYRKLVDDATAKKNCLSLVGELLGRQGEKDTLQALNLEKDSKTMQGLTFEITPPTAEDAYKGWWISVYSESKLNLARASDEEMRQISVPKASATKEGDWSARELELSRPALANTITFTNKSGLVIRDAEVVRINEGVSLVWRDAGGGGVVKLFDLPPDLRARFGYDHDKSAAVEAAEEAAKARDWQQAQAQARVVQAAKQPEVPSPAVQAADAPSYSYSGPSGRGSVYVHGYTKQNGTYVQPYTRSAPRR